MCIGEHFFGAAVNAMISSALEPLEWNSEAVKGAREDLILQGDPASA